MNNLLFSMHRAMILNRLYIGYWKSNTYCFTRAKIIIDNDVLLYFIWGFQQLAIISDKY